MSRMLTGSPSMTRNRPSKSDRCSGSSSITAASRSWDSVAMIMRWTIGRRSVSKNMCSVRRHSPMPSAPCERARSASRG